MITKKCAAALGIFSLSLFLILAAVEFMSLFPAVSKWLGFGIGVGALAALFVLYIVFHKRRRNLPIVIIVLAAPFTGITLSSVFVLIGRFPPIWQTAVLYVGFIALFYLYCLLTNLGFVRKHCTISLIIFSLLLITAEILFIIFYNSEISVLAGLSLIPLIAFLISLSIDADDRKEHFKNMAFCSFGYLLVAVVVVLVILSEGEGLDGAGGSLDGGLGHKRNNPFEYNYYV